MHRLSGAVLLPCAPARVTRDALVAHLQKVLAAELCSTAGHSCPY